MRIKAARKEGGDKPLQHRQRNAPEIRAVRGCGRPCPEGEGDV